MLVTDLDKVSKQILLGSVLGDGCLSIPKLGRNAFFKEEHAVKQEPYLRWKVMYLKKHFKINVRSFSRYNRNFISATTNCSPILTNFYKSIYKNKIKAVDKKILDEIDEFGLAVWYCDDGNYRLRFGSCVISTCSFTLEENREIKKWLKNKWDLDCVIRTLKRNNHKYFYLEFDVNNANKFLLLIKNFILSMPDCVWYKVGHLYDGNISLIKFHKKMDNERCKIYYNKMKSIRLKTCDSK
ncbi:MAG: hypothetical protein HZB67_02385 [Candidatus Aenigmarchaeota archaeon]|nr:hypothetical protein [Candidatus Aenigmarchaeota archaeon]